MCLLCLHNRVWSYDVLTVGGYKFITLYLQASVPRECCFVRSSGEEKICSNYILSRDTDKRSNVFSFFNFSKVILYYYRILLLCYSQAYKLLAPPAGSVCVKQALPVCQPFSSLNLYPMCPLLFLTKKICRPGPVKKSKYAVALYIISTKCSQSARTICRDGWKKKYTHDTLCCKYL